MLVITLVLVIGISLCLVTIKYKNDTLHIKSTYTLTEGIMRSNIKVQKSPINRSPKNPPPHPKVRKENT